MPLSPETEARLEQVRHNYALYEQLRDSEQFLDWAATALFYAALHLVDAHAIEIGRRTLDNDGDVFGKGEGHKSRFDYVQLSLPLLVRAYRRLFDLSRDTRYRFGRPSRRELVARYEPDYQAVLRVIGAHGIAP